MYNFAKEVHGTDGIKTGPWRIGLTWRVSKRGKVQAWWYGWRPDGGKDKGLYGRPEEAWPPKKRRGRDEGLWNDGMEPGCQELIPCGGKEEVSKASTWGVALRQGTLRPLGRTNNEGSQLNDFMRIQVSSLQPFTRLWWLPVYLRNTAPVFGSCGHAILKRQLDIQRIS